MQLLALVLALAEGEGEGEDEDEGEREGEGEGGGAPAPPTGKHTFCALTCAFFLTHFLHISARPEIDHVFFQKTRVFPKKHKMR